MINKFIWRQKTLRDLIRYSILIILLVSICTGIGTINLTNDSSIIRDLLSSIIGWFIWTSIIYFIGVKLMKNSSTFTQLARTLGVAYSPWSAKYLWINTDYFTTLTGSNFNLDDNILYLCLKTCTSDIGRKSIPLYHCLALFLILFSEVYCLFYDFFFSFIYSAFILSIMFLSSTPLNFTLL